MPGQHPNVTLGPAVGWGGGDHLSFQDRGASQSPSGLRNNTLCSRCREKLQPEEGPERPAATQGQETGPKAGCEAPPATALRSRGERPGALFQAGLLNSSSLRFLASAAAFFLFPCDLSLLVSHLFPLFPVSIYLFLSFISCISSISISLSFLLPFCPPSLSLFLSLLSCFPFIYLFLFLSSRFSSYSSLCLLPPGPPSPHTHTLNDQMPVPCLPATLYLLLKETKHLFLGLSPILS